jgi:hypothetical protein
MRHPIAIDEVKVPPHYPPAVQEALVDAGLHASIPGPIWDRPALRMRMYGNKWKMSPK